MMKRIIAAVVSTALLLLLADRPAGAAPAAVHRLAPVSAAAAGWYSWGSFTIATRGTGLCLDADTNGGGGNGNKVQVWICNNENQQWWNLWESSRGSHIFYIQNVKYGRCLDADAGTLPANGTRVQLWDCTSTLQQQWYLPWLSNPGDWTSWYPFYTGKSHASGLDADSSNGVVPGSKVQVWRYGGAANQQWHPWPAG